MILNEGQLLMSDLSPVQSRLLNAAVQVRQSFPTEIDKVFTARELIQATLPHRNPGDVPLWSRKNGNYVLAIQPGMDIASSKSFGYPYGSIPRLLLFWMTTEALRAGNRRLQLSESLAEFMRQLGLNPATGGGKRGDAKRLRDQMERLFNARISFNYTEPGHKQWLHMEIAPQGELWWNDRNPHEPALFNSWIELGEKFYQAITENPVPVDMRALQTLKNSPLALDLYAWTTYKAYLISQKGKSQRIPWRALLTQLGAEYKDIQEFRKSALHALKKIQLVYPELRLEIVEGGLEIKPSRPAIAANASKREQLSLPAASKQTKPQPAKAIAKGSQSIAQFTAISTEAREAAKNVALAANTGWDISVLEQQFYNHAQKKGVPADIDAAFLGFVTKKVRKSP